MPLGRAAVALEQLDARRRQQPANALAGVVATEEGVQHRAAPEPRQAERLARGGAADRLPVAERELHVRHGLGQAVELDDAIPGGWSGDEDVVGHPFILA